MQERDRCRVVLHLPAEPFVRLVKRRMDMRMVRFYCGDFAAARDGMVTKDDFRLVKTL
jgi:hypothetical protein